MPDTIKIGDRYHRPGELRLVYRVVGMARPAHHPPHVTLVSENADHRVISIGVSVMLDRRQWIPAE